MTNILSAAQIFTIARIAGFSPPDAVVATAITMPEAGANADAIQAGQPYSTTGWGLWQITPGNSVPSVAIDYGLLIPQNNADAAFIKFRGARNTFRPWTTWTSGKYLKWMGWAQAGAAAAGAGGIIIPPPGSGGTPTGPGGSPDPVSLIGGTMAAWDNLSRFYNDEPNQWRGTFDRIGPW